MINQKELVNGAYAIYCDLLKYFSDNAENEIKSYYDSIKQWYDMGMISEEELPDEDSISDIAEIEVDGQYIEITFYYVSMIVEPWAMEELIWEKWIQTRRCIINNIHNTEFSFIHKRNLGIRIKGVVAVSGETHNDWFATVFTPEDIHTIYGNDK